MLTHQLGRVVTRHKQALSTFKLDTFRSGYELPDVKREVGHPSQRFRSRAGRARSWRAGAWRYRTAWESSLSACASASLVSYKVQPFALVTVSGHFSIVRREIGNFSWVMMAAIVAL